MYSNIIKVRLNHVVLFKLLVTIIYIDVQLFDVRSIGLLVFNTLECCKMIFLN